MAFRDDFRRIEAENRREAQAGFGYSSAMTSVALKSRLTSPFAMRVIDSLVRQIGGTIENRTQGDGAILVVEAPAT